MKAKMAGQRGPPYDVHTLTLHALVYSSGITNNRYTLTHALPLPLSGHGQVFRYMSTPRDSEQKVLYTRKYVISMYTNSVRNSAG